MILTVNLYTFLPFLFYTFEKLFMGPREIELLVVFHETRAAREQFKQLKVSQKRCGASRIPMADFYKNFLFIRRTSITYFLGALAWFI